MARGWRYTKLSPLSAFFSVARVLRVCAMHPAYILWVPCASLHPTVSFLAFFLCYCFVLLFFCRFCLFYVLFLILYSRWSFVDVPLIFSCSADHVPGWQRCILLGMVEARSVIRKNTHIHTHTTDFQKNTLDLSGPFYLRCNIIYQSIETTLRRRRILFAGFVARVEDTSLPMCVIFGVLVEGAGGVGGQEKE